MPVAQVILGLALVFAGRKLYWLFVGVAGFVLGMLVGPQLLNGESDLVAFALALGIGVLGAILALAVHRLAVAVGGILAGGYLGAMLAQMLNLEPDWLAWGVVVVGAVMGTILLTTIFEYALIGLSALVGGLLVVQQMNLEQPVSMLALGGMLLIGVVAQYVALRREQKGDAEKRKAKSD